MSQLVSQEDSLAIFFGNLFCFCLTGDVVLHQHFETKMWSRAQVVDLIEKPEIEDQLVVVYYFDYGNTAVSSVSM
jgi:hypothetical protein